MPLRFRHRRGWLTELAGLVSGGLVVLSLALGFGLDERWWLAAAFAASGVVMTIAAELPRRRMRAENAETTAEIHRFISEVIEPCERERERRQALERWQSDIRHARGGSREE
ncbi:hypothetical protein ACFV0H_41310 [Streptomyces erythrochromogenes]|uniref:hypothetical protein n=1 Tax=Streptomyces erythrochromogenes TaxID=285574 RepID=UPI0036C687D6